MYLDGFGVPSRCGQGFAIITSVAFTTAVTESPFFSFMSSALRLVITDDDLRLHADPGAED
jgi:hypothetical protein